MCCFGSEYWSKPTDDGRIEEDDPMLETLVEIMELKIDEIRKEGRREGIQSTVNILQKFKFKDAEIKLAIMEQYQLTEKEAAGYLRP